MKKIVILFVISLIFYSCTSVPEMTQYTYYTARIFPTVGNSVSGVLHFKELGDSVEITGTLTGLSPGKHGFHIHQWGDLTTEDGKSAGGHYNPDDTAHGAREAEVRHVGDLGNIEADGNGIAEISIVDDKIALNGPQSILGRAVIIHEKEDDYGQPTGNAGSRVGYGVIGLASDQ